MEVARLTALLAQADDVTAEDPSARAAELRQTERLAAAELNWARVAVSITPKAKEAAALDDVVKRLRAAPAELLARAALPIEGLGLADNDITWQTEPDGPAKPGATLCGREQIMLGLQIARATTPSGIICIDGIEALSEAAFAEFLAATEGDDCQYWVTQVSPAGGELSVKTIDPDPALDAAADKAKAATARQKGKGKDLLF